MKTPKKHSFKGAPTFLFFVRDNLNSTPSGLNTQDLRSSACNSEVRLGPSFLDKDFKVRSPFSPMFAGNFP